jgi:hypothetical protein
MSKIAELQEFKDCNLIKLQFLKFNNIKTFSVFERQLFLEYKVPKNEIV